MSEHFPVGNPIRVAGSEPRLDPWLSTWIAPRKTIRQIVASDPKHLVLPLAAIGGIFRAIDLASRRSYGDVYPMPVLLIGIVGLGIVAGILGLYVVAWALQLTGGWMGGRASAEEIRAAVAWPNVLTAWIFIPFLGILALVRGDLFTSETPRLHAYPLLALALLGFSLLVLVVEVWTMVVSVKMLAEVQGFSAWKALGQMVLAYLYLAIWAVGIALLFFVMRVTCGR